MRDASTPAHETHIARLDAVGLAIPDPESVEAQAVVPLPKPTRPRTKPIEDSKQPLPQHTYFPNVTSPLRRMRTKFGRFVAHHKIVGKSKGSTWQGIADVAFEIGNSERVRRGVVLLDTQSEFDLISTRFARGFGLDFDDVQLETFAVTVNGDEVFSVANRSLKARWYTEKGRSRLSFRSKGPSLWRYIEADFFIIKSDQFDVIIGQRSINEHRLFENQSLLAPFRGQIGPNNDDEEQERRARERREKAAKEREQHAQAGSS